jgi:hypothetical protein
MPHCRLSVAKRAFNGWPVAVVVLCGRAQPVGTGRVATLCRAASRNRPIASARPWLNSNVRLPVSMR